MNQNSRFENFSKTYCHHASNYLPITCIILDNYWLLKVRCLEFHSFGMQILFLMPRDSSWVSSRARITGAQYIFILTWARLTLDIINIYCYNTLLSYCNNRPFCPCSSPCSITYICTCYSRSLVTDPHCIIWNNF